MDTQKMEQSRNSLERLKNTVDGLIAALQTMQADFRQKLQSEQNKTAEEHVKVEILSADIGKLKSELVAAQDISEHEARLQQLQNEIENKTTKITNLQTEVQNLNNALTNRKTQLETLESKNKELSSQLEAVNAKVLTLEQAEKDTREVDILKQKLETETWQKNELAQKCQEQEIKLSEMQTALDLTSENIDDVVARLEKVLEENGTSNHND